LEKIMSKSALLDLIPSARRKVIWHEEDGQVRIETKQDVSNVIRAAGALADEPPGKDFRRVALIPLEVLNKALLEGWANDPDQWKRWANNSENACYRTWHGTI
jgi:hypothetical protein